MKDHELRFSDTNSADDSEGKTRGLDGNLFWFIVLKKVPKKVRKKSKKGA